MGPTEVCNHIRATYGINISDSTLHHWEREGVLSDISRSDAQQRDYDAKDLGTIEWVAIFRFLDYSIDEIKRHFSGDTIYISTTIADRRNKFKNNLIPKLEKVG